MPLNLSEVAAAAGVLTLHITIAITDRGELMGPTDQFQGGGFVPVPTYQNRIGYCGN